MPNSLALQQKYRYLFLKETLKNLKNCKVEYTQDSIEMEQECERHNNRIENFSQIIASEILDYISHISINLSQLGHKLPASLHGLRETILSMASAISATGYEENITDFLAIEIAAYNHPYGDSPLIATKEDLIEEKHKGFEEGYEAALTALKKTAFSPRKLDLEET